MRGPHPGERLFAPEGPQPTKGRKPAAGGVIPLRRRVFARVHPAGMPRRRRTGAREGRPRGSKRATRNASRLAGGGANVTFQPRSVPERRRSARRNIDRGRACATLARPRSLKPSRHAPRPARPLRPRRLGARRMRDLERPLRLRAPGSGHLVLGRGAHRGATRLARVSGQCVPSRGSGSASRGGATRAGTETRVTG